MKVRYLVHADHVDACEGKHYISGGGGSNMQVAPQGPGSSVLVVPRFGIALAIDVPYGATSEKHTIRVQIEDDDRQPVLPQPIEAPFESGRPPGMRHNDWLTAKMAFNIQPLPFPKEGIYSIVVDIDGTESERQYISVQRAALMQMV